MAIACLLFFPKLALGLSGFETGVAVMPLVKGDPDDDPHRPRWPHSQHAKAACHRGADHVGHAVGLQRRDDDADRAAGADSTGKVKRRCQPALAYIAHGETEAIINPLFGDMFGTIYDISTVAILWFAGASAMSGLLNLVPRYLPRYGMAPKWAEAIRALVIVFTLHQPVRHLDLRRRASSRKAEPMPPACMVLMSSAAWRSSSISGESASGPWLRRLSLGISGRDC